jgi:hypothetical protein
MKVTGPGSSGSVGAGNGAKRTAAPGFAPASMGGAREAAGAGPAMGVTASTLDALIAMQATPNALERRRRAVSRAGKLLDVLDDVKLALLDGGNSAVALERLRGAVREQREATEDPRLEGVLDEIETRAAVELAKQEMARAAA